MSNISLRNKYLNLNKNIKLWNYDLEDYHIYNIDNIVCDRIYENSAYNMEDEIFILH